MVPELLRRDDVPGWVTVFVRDSVFGRPAAGLALRIEHSVAGRWVAVSNGETGDDGVFVVPEGQLLAPAAYQLVVDTGPYYAGLGIRPSLAELALAIPLPRHDARVRIEITLAPCGSAAYIGR